MFYHASLQYSQNGTDWQSVPGTFDSAPLIRHTFADPVQARYVRFVAASVNPGGQWVKIREFQVLPPQTAITSNLTPSNGSTPANAFDANVETTFTTQPPTVAGLSLTRTFDTPQHLGSIAVVGTAVGVLQVEDGSGWHTVQTLIADRSFQEMALDQNGAKAVRLVLGAGTPASAIDELVTRGSGPVGQG
jgi:hyaluronoglucosaminidase